MSLDDLLTSAPEHREAPDPGRFGVWVWVRILAACAVAAFAVYQVLLASGFKVPYLLLLTVMVGALVARRITAAARGTLPPPPASTVRQRRAPDPDRDQEYRAAWRWNSRLSVAERDVDSFHKRVRPAIVALIDERLRLRHGVDRPRDPVRAQALLPDQLWRFVTEPSHQVPKPPQLVAIAEQIENL
ncbi:MAG: hypothetical protein ACRDUA_11745 [Micromonosporaceae bacterium]